MRNHEHLTLQNALFTCCRLLSVLLMASIGAAFTQAAARELKRPDGQPNILLILAEDLGYGDVHCYNDQSKVATPHLDRLAHEELFRAGDLLLRTELGLNKIGLMSHARELRKPRRTRPNLNRKPKD